MMKIEKFLRDCIYTFAYYIYEGLVIITHIASELILSLRSLIYNLIIPLTIDLCSDLVYISIALTYEMFYILSTLFLQTSKLTHYLSQYFLERAEKISHKRAW
jgi:hypothetical protein